MRFAATALIGLLGCAGPVEVTRVLSADEASRAQTSSFEAVAVVREDGNRVELPAGTRITRGRAVLTHADSYVHKLGPRDVIETDDAGRIVAVRGSDSNDVVRFVAGTATSATGSDEVRGKLVDDDPSVSIGPHDLVEMHGRVSPGDAIPSGGRVESSRATGVLIGGAVVFTLAYAPAAYVASQSPADKALFIPFAGPWIDLATRPACTPPVLPAGVSLPVDPCIGETIARAALVLSGALQGLGGILALFGLPAHSEVVGADRGVARGKSLHVSFVPTGLGAAAFGTF
jgi:hypothetical protein